MLPVHKLSALPRQELPSYNDWSGCVIDVDGRYLYIFGGCPPVRDREREVTADLFRLDLEQVPMVWENLTDKMRRITDRHLPDKTPVPKRSQAGVAFFSDRGLPHLLIYGGWQGEEPALPTLISVDLTDYTWREYKLQPEGMQRLDPALAVRGNRLYIMGGEETDLHALRETPAEHTYSVLEYEYRDDSWSWVHRDVAVPPACGELGFEATAIPWEGGILVVRGKGVGAFFDPRDEEKGRYASLNGESFLNYDPAADAWSVLQTDIVGAPPPRAQWISARGTEDGVAVCVWYARNNKADSPIDLDVWAYSRPGDGAGAGRLRRLHVGAAVEQCERAHGLDFSVFQALRNGRLVLLGAHDPPGPNPPYKRYDVLLDVTDAVRDAP